MKKHHFTLPYNHQEKQVRVMLPKTYKQSNQSYPVLYMHDGKNLFHKRESYANSTWGVRKALREKEIILVAIDNSEDRIQEYIPFRRPYLDNIENYGDQYMQWLVYELKPFIDNSYRTLSKRENTYIAGSSLGGLISAYAISKYRAVFSIAGIFSLAVVDYWQELKEIMNRYPLADDSKVFIQVGTHEVYDYEKKKLDLNASQVYLNQTLQYYQELLRLGLPYENIYLNIEIDAKHNEKAWKEAFPKFVQLLTTSDLTNEPNL